ncbi:hypothetical protein [Cytobacillus horneckiae]|uniref:hypothetical protein n=1 Tax=Cytobacillus horneckiae TaxID=549687 RepID=UPI003D9AA204
MKNHIMTGEHWATIIIETRNGPEEVLVDMDDLLYAEEITRLVLYKDPKGRKMARADKTDNQVLLHRHLFDIPKDAKIEWLNENALDLRRENLQLVFKEGSVKRLKVPEPPIPKGRHDIHPLKKKSKTRGVYFHKASRKWHASAFYEKKRYSLGYFEDEHEAELEVLVFREEGPDSPKLKRNQRGK